MIHKSIKYIECLLYCMNEWMVYLFGYDLAVKLQEWSTWLSGLLLGCIISLFIFSKLFLSFRRDSEMSPNTVIKMSDGKKHLIGNPKKMSQVIELVFLGLLWSVTSPRAKYKKIDIKHDSSQLFRIRSIMTVLLILAVIFIIIGWSFILTIVEPLK